VEIARRAGAGAALLAAEAPAELASGLAAAGAVVVAGAAPAGRGRLPGAGRPGAGDGAQPAYVMFTSGSTGQPKGVPVPRSAVRHFAAWIGEVAAGRDPGAPPVPGPAAAPADVVLCQAPFSFDLSVMSLCLALGRGGTLFLVGRREVADPPALFSALRSSGLTVWVSTPSFARFCLAEPSFAEPMLPRLRRFLFCGEALPAATARRLLERFPRAEVWNTYGPTEATVAVTAVRLTPALLAGGDPLPVGRPAPGVRVWVAPEPGDAAADPLPEGEPGEIVIAGPQLAGPYLAPAASGGFVRLPAAAGGERAYRSGDAGVVRAGLLYCLGRLDRQVKLHGYRLELEEIEHHLRRLPGVGDAAALLVSRRGIPDHLVALVSPEAPATAAAQGDPSPAWRAELARHLPSYALPRLIRVVEPRDWPLTANGKVDRAALERML
jgi:D-alanine--poly(phosphoribitol) ligase subunit 1